MNESTHISLSPEEIQVKVLSILRELIQELGNEPALRQLGPKAKLAQNLGLDSLAKVELFTRLEQEFSFHFTDQSIVEIETPEDIVKTIIGGEGAIEEGREIVEHEIVKSERPDHAETLAEVLIYQAERLEEQTHIILRNEDGTETNISYGRLLKKSLMLANALRERGLQPQETVTIMLPTSEEFFYSFFGVLLAGGVAVPLYPPFRADLLEEYAKRQVGILKNASARFMITFSQAKAVALLLKPQVPSLIEVTSAQALIEGQEGHEDAIPKITGEFPALIQYTSGSTGSPKGVQLLHKNLLANMRAISKTIKVAPGDVCVSWLPLYHDMGLIGAWLTALYSGNPIYIISPLAFLTRPERWLWAIHKNRGSISPAPNFAYELCIRKIKEEDLEGLDLSSWRVAFNGAEPVSRSTLERFAEKFGKYGFSEKTMYPVYGLAESCVAVCFPPLERGPVYDVIKRDLFEQKGIAEPSTAEEDPNNKIEFVGAGGPLIGHEVRLLDGEGNILPDRVQGRLQFRGPSVMEGYYNNQEATDKVIQDGWCDSGDLAYRVEDDYFITGREKDLIIKGGRNLYPQEVEELVADVPGIRRGCVIAFGVKDLNSGTEQIIVAAETKPNTDTDKIIEGVQETLTQHLGLPADKVLLLEPGTIPKTSSGKVRRAACKKMFLEEALIDSKKSTVVQVTRLIFRAIPSFFGGMFQKGKRAAWVTWYAFILTTTFFPLWLVLHIIRSQKLAFFLTKAWCSLFLVAMRIKVEVKDKEHLTENVPALIVSNHSSYLDVVLYTAVLNKPFRFLGKKEALDSPLIGPFMRSNEHIGIDRQDLQQSLKDKDQVFEHLKRDISVVIFPEATFTRAVGLRPFRLGAFHIAAEKNSKIIPLALNGARKVLPSGNFVPKRGKIILQFGAPIEPQGSEWKEVIRLRDDTLKFITEHCGEPQLNLSYSDVPVSS